MRYNLGRFNLGDSKVKIEAHSTIDIFFQINDVIVERRATAGITLVDVDSSSSWVLEKRTDAQISDMTFESEANGEKLVISSNASSDLELNSFAKGAQLGEEYIEITNVSLAKNDEITINLCDLIILVNNEDYLNKKISGEFFKLLSGINEIDIEAVGAEGIEIDITWKDRWL